MSAISSTFGNWSSEVWGSDTPMLGVEQPAGAEQPIGPPPGRKRHCGNATHSGHGTLSGRSGSVLQTTGGPDGEIPYWRFIPGHQSNDSMAPKGVFAHRQRS